MAGKFEFASGLPDCCTSNPGEYKVVAEIPGARLVEMCVPPGGADKPHEHPAHAMYFVVDCKLSIIDGPDPSKGEPHVVEIPAGAAPIFPAGSHQVTNVGDKEARVIFVESFPDIKECGTVDGFKAPFETDPACYTILAQDDNWITGIMEMKPGESDTLHNHRDHLIYVVSGDEVTIYPDGKEEDGHAVPIKKYAGIPAPMAAGPIFAHHRLKNTGKEAVKMVFFEMKK